MLYPFRYYCFDIEIYSYNYTCKMYLQAKLCVNDNMFVINNYNIRHFYANVDSL